MNYLAKYPIILSLSFLAFMNVGNADDLGEFFVDVTDGYANLDQNLYAQLLAVAAPGITKHRVVTFDVSALNTDHRFEEDEVGYAWRMDESVRMTLFPGESIIVKNTRVAQRGRDEKWTWVGKVEGRPYSVVLLTFDKTSSTVLGYINTGRELYELTPINDKYHLLAKASHNRAGAFENDTRPESFYEERRKKDPSFEKSTEEGSAPIQSERK